jgi:hypothetical protein
MNITKNIFASAILLGSQMIYAQDEEGFTELTLDTSTKGVPVAKVGGSTLYGKRIFLTATKSPGHSWLYWNSCDVGINDYVFVSAMELSSYNYPIAGSAIFTVENVVNTNCSLKVRVYSSWGSSLRIGLSILLVP